MLITTATALLAALQAIPQPCPTCPWHPVNAQRTEVTYSFYCVADTARLRYQNKYAFDPRGHGKSVQLVEVRTSVRSLTSDEKSRLADFFRGFALVENVKGRCHGGDFLIDVTGVSKAALDEAAASNRRELPKPVQRTDIVRKAGGIRLPEIDAGGVA